MPFTFFVIIALSFGFVGGLMAFLITYGEYSRHFMTKKRVVKISLETASVIFAVLFMTTVVAAYVFSKG